MPMMSMSREFVVRSTHGHTVHFKPGQVRYVNSVIEDECKKYGAEYVEPGKVEEFKEELKNSDMGVEGMDQTKFIKIKEAMDLMLSRTHEGDFTAGGRPSMDALKSLLGQEPIDNKERDAVWDEVSKGQAIPSNK